ncbi:trehalose 6-phosphate phosphatase [Compostimonas suwonensis]|uniref:Trehalose 6-phosphate phosphatase n=1 Tax=Compostimonas suwonensis TaxID=1048394 RepID=A0A2M9BBD7_9MICO|nr:trehalose 6-phosphate phosphatase [Compostimonas suwonensis]
MGDSAIPAALRDALTELGGAEHVLVALDFDGTLAPEVDTPDEARALPASAAALRALEALPRTSVALVSGRSLESLERVAEAPASVLLVGSHGVELRLGDADRHPPLSGEEEATAVRLEQTLRDVADGFDGAWVERKPAGYALHTRLSSADDARAAQELARIRVEAAFRGLTPRVGKNVLEFAVRSATKGDGIAALREFTGATAVLYAGDDVTDEDGFRALGAGDVGIKVGEGETAAAFRVTGPEAMAEVLRLLAESRARLVLPR